MRTIRVSPRLSVKRYQDGWIKLRKLGMPSGMSRSLMIDPRDAKGLREAIGCDTSPAA